MKILSETPLPSQKEILKNENIKTAMKYENSNSVTKINEDAIESSDS